MFSEIDQAKAADQQANFFCPMLGLFDEAQALYLQTGDPEMLEMIRQMTQEALTPRQPQFPKLRRFIGRIIKL
jgi:hypothetical protein